jgi:NhaP-type Na+/H+ or K+/H+ antiporter
VYPGPDSLLFLFAGPMVVFIDVETARRIDPTNWAIKAANMLKTGVVAAAGGFLVLAVVLFRVVLRIALDNPSMAWDLLTMLVVIGVGTVVFAIVVVGSSVRWITKRVAHLDALTEEELRAEAARDKRSFQATAGDLSDVRIDPLTRSGVLGAAEGGPAARLSFRHRPTGRWKLNLVTLKDTKAAARAFRQLLGRDQVAVNVALRGD